MWHRRELLGALGVGGASTLLWAFGCGGPQKRVDGAGASEQTRLEVRTWLRDAVARLAAVFPQVHALAVTRQRTAAAIDVLGTGVARTRRDGVVLTVRDRGGQWREQVTYDMTQGGIVAAARALAGDSNKRASLVFGEPPRAPPDVRELDERELYNRVDAIGRLEAARNSRIVYAAAMIDVEDCHVWSISPTSDREQRLVRVRKRVTRAAWHGERPVVGEAERAYIGGIDEQPLDADVIAGATQTALEPMTPGGLDDGVRELVLDPSVSASLVDAGTRALLTSAAARRVEVAKRIVIGQGGAAPLLTLVDDPTTRGAYGGFQFDDEGEPAAPVTLIDAGRVAAVLADRAGGGRGRGLRPGHVGVVEPAPSHLRLAGGSVPHESLRSDGVILEGGLGAVIDPSTNRIVIGAARARETKAGKLTGRVYADVELVGDLGALLGGVTGVAQEVGVTAYRDEVDGEPRWRSIEAPYLRTRGLVRSRRRRA